MDIAIGLPNMIAGITRDPLLDWARSAEARGFAGFSSLYRLMYPGYEPARLERTLLDSPVMRLSGD